MKLSKHSGQVVFTLATLVAIVLLGGTASAQPYRVLYDFGQGAHDGWDPVGVPAAAKNGDLYAVTEAGGTYNLGTIFKLIAPQTRGGAWTKTLLYDCPGGKGGVSPVSVVIDKDGNLYGVDSSQTIFELSRSRDGAWKYTVLYTLNGNSDGSVTSGNLIFDSEANLYGANEQGGDLGCGNGGGCGTVFELKRPAKTGGKWRFSVLHTFTGSPDGAAPFSGVVFDQNRNLYGTTNEGGSTGWGTVYRLSPPAEKGQGWTETLLYSFSQSNDGIISPEGPVLFDKSGNLYGTTPSGGDLNCAGGYGCGVVFELSPPDKKGGAWNYATLYAFQGGNDGIIPYGYMVFDQAGNLYGVTELGGVGGVGTVYRMSPPKGNGGVWTETVLHGFTGNNGDGADPDKGLAWGKWHDLYGLTQDGGLCFHCGIAFEVQP
jgi:uncharacterized repeat protein (TIGR03803 family)